MFRQNKAAIKIQTFWRGYSAREKLRVLKKERYFALQNAAATVIQVCSGLCLGTFAPVLFPPSDRLHYIINILYNYCNTSRWLILITIFLFSHRKHTKLGGFKVS